MVTYFDKILNSIILIRKKYGLLHTTRSLLNKVTKEYKPSRLSKNQKQIIRKYFKDYLGLIPCLKWSQYFISVAGRFDHRYITMDILYGKIVPKLNNTALMAGWQDKNLTDTLLSKIPQPDTIIKNMDGNFYNGNNVPITLAVVKQNIFNGTFIIKPSLNTGGGKGVNVLDVRNGYLNNNQEIIDYINNEYYQNYIIQKKITQHPDIAKFNPTSVNTIRYLSYRDTEGKIIPLSAILRIGRLGSIIDNGGAGGLFCGINDDGSLKDFGLTFPYKSQSYRSDTGVIFKGSFIPNFGGVTDSIKLWHSYIPYFDIIAWDIAIDKEGKAVLIEFNIEAPGINLLQLANGPIFKELTEEVLTRVR